MSRTYLEVDVSDVAQRLRKVLAGQSFPAARWEIICAAEVYGADGRSRRELQALPEREYAGLAEVLLAVERNRDRVLAR